jgi:hypothetical protein
VVELSLADPERPTVTTVSGVDWQPKALHYAEGRLYAAARGGGLGVLGVEDVGPLQELTFLDTMGTVEAVAPVGSGAWVVARDGLWIWNASEAPRRVVDSDDTGWEAVSLAAGDDYVAAGGNGMLPNGDGGGLWILDREPQGSATVIGLVPFAGEWVTGVAVEDRTAYVRSVRGSREERLEYLHVVDLTDLAAPRLLASLTRRPGSTQGSTVVAGSGKVYVEEGESGVWVVDATERTAPSDLGLVATGGDPVTGLALAEGHLYVASGRIVDVLEVSERPEGVPVGSWLSPGQSEIHELSADQGVLVALTSGLEGAISDDAKPLVVRAASLANASAPQETGHAALPLGAASYQVAVKGQLAYVAAGKVGLAVLELAGPGRQVHLPFAYRR